MATIGIIGGSGLYQIEGIRKVKEVSVKTPFGAPSDKFITGELEGVPVVFLPRHGRGHRISPSEINYRANIYGMKKLGVEAIMSVSACGSLKAKYKPMDFVIPDQFLDRTRKGRIDTFFTDGIVAHAAFADPVSGEIADILEKAARSLKLRVHRGGTYVNMEGPQFSTKAESNLYRSWGMDVIGMTNLTEAKLAREAEISYATLAAVTDYDCWHPSHDSVTLEMVIGYLNKNVANAKAILKIAIGEAGKLKRFSAAGAMKFAVMTNPAVIPARKKKELGLLIGKYIK
ncbi:MAG: S-methyl-5'-thioadenosine phosphorylase [Candidatus Omnitrophica bacterium]|nr:S-methyl-5'-thioadenosine phosphorylase [Candidatus Omnitrophota bacterium]MDE2214485.1 S-methyl-5'-thioadenosine phosphorylase [Candidatus Omnitrophota bacterium]MDE2230803.1 S-methyl-5'-thioadenosine phosphorylase [Candidatus Omnitrophota bacterium]